METDYLLDEVFGERLLISYNADKNELNSNIRAARAIYCIGHKNPEYTICNDLGDRKRIMSEKGVTAGFKSAKKQGCKVVVIDLDEHVHHLDSFVLSKYISRRKEDFTLGMITDCYVVFCGKAVRVNARYQTRIEIEHKIETLRP